jgi:hypothetical protein
MKVNEGEKKKFFCEWKWHPAGRRSTSDETSQLAHPANFAVLRFSRSALTSAG